MSMSMSSSTPATVRVEKATSDLLMGPDWTLNMDICDSVNSDHWQAKDVIKAVKKRLQHRNPKVQFLALTLLETMIKNCGDYVHFQVVEREILQEMVKIVRKKTDMQVRDKILVLLDSWQEAFGGAGGKYPQYYWAYADLKRSGVQFPERSPDSTLIFTPPALTSPGTRRPQVGYGMPSNSAVRLDEAMASEMANLSLSDVDSMHSVMELLSEMLKAVNPNDRSAIEDEVIIDLVSQCRSNQKKLMQSINSIRDEELLGRGLELNDNIQSLLAKHDAIASGSPVPVEASESNPKAPIVAQPKAVEVSETVPSPSTPIAPQPATTNRYDDEKEDEDDDFAQLARRNSIFNPNSADSKSVATSNHLRSPNQSVTPSTVAGSMDGASSTQASNALTLPDPPNPVKTASKEQDIIDLLSITLSSNPSPPRTPVTPPNISDYSASPPPIPSAQHFNPQSPMPYDVNQTYIPQNNYVTPWAQAQTHSSSPLQSQTQSEVPLNSSGYPPPPWAIALANTSANSSAAAAYQHSVPDFGGGGPTYSTQASRPMQRFYSFGSGVSNVSTIITEARSNPNLGQTGPSTARPYVYTNRLFNELADFRTSNPDAKNKPAPSLSGTSGPGMISGRK